MLGLGGLVFKGGDARVWGLGFGVEDVGVIWS